MRKRIEDRRSRIEDRKTPGSAPSSILHPPSSLPAPRGATLIEVLMALMIMGIGVVSVATLFPIAILRSLQATQITHATILRLNAESMIDFDSRVLQGVPDWQPDTAYVAGATPDIVISTTPGNRFFICTTAGTSDPTEPAWDTNLGATTTEPVGGVQWQTFDHSRYVVDSLGWNIAGTAPADYQQNFGNDGAGGLPLGLVLPRLHAGRTTLGSAEALVTLPDSWESLHESLNFAATATSVTINDIDVADLALLSNGNEDLNGDGLLDPGEDVNADGAGNQILDRAVSRVVLVDATGKHSIARNIVAGGINGNVVTWSEDTNGNGTLDGGDTDFNNNGALDGQPLPAGVLPAQIAQVRIETQQRNYTWLLTVRKNDSGQANADVVVFFRRSLPAAGGEPTDERVYDNIGPGATVRQYEIDLGAGDRPEFLKKGGFLFDADHARWYRIVDLDEDINKVILTLDRRSPIGEDIGRAMFPRGVIDVYPLPSKL